MTRTVQTLALAAALLATPALAADPPPSPVSSIRNKLSAADLLSAESILEVHEKKAGRDSPYLEGLGWLARGALMLGDEAKAQRYADDACRECEARVAAGADLATDRPLATALGAGIEARAQLIERSGGKLRAVRYLEEQLARYAKPVSLRSRISKRINLTALRGMRAPELAIEDWLGEKPQGLAAHHGRPVLLFVWDPGCGDCKAQEPALAEIKSKYQARGLDVVALTRFYDEDRVAEKARADSVWNDVYRDVGPIPRIISTVSMERYGGSSTPTFVFIDRDGVVRDYLPTRLTTAEFDRRLTKLLD
jgi:thiol-disulfide isomerase/thioredoxin